MTLRIHEYPDPILKQKCATVKYSAKIRQLAMDMLNLMYQSDGIGLAAPQVGKSFRMFVLDCWWPQTGTCDRAMVFINPVLKLGKEQVQSLEGCLSLPGQSQTVPRAKTVHVEAMGLDGRRFALNADGLLSICIQHEADHLDGVLMTDIRS